MFLVHPSTAEGAPTSRQKSRKGTHANQQQHQQQQQQQQQKSDAHSSISSYDSSSTQLLCCKVCLAWVEMVDSIAHTAILVMWVNSAVFGWMYNCLGHIGEYVVAADGGTGGEDVTAQAVRSMVLWKQQTPALFDEFGDVLRALCCCIHSVIISASKVSASELSLDAAVAESVLTCATTVSGF